MTKFKIFYIEDRSKKNMIIDALDIKEAWHIGVDICKTNGYPVTELELEQVVKYDSNFKQKRIRKQTSRNIKPVV